MPTHRVVSVIRAGPASAMFTRSNRQRPWPFTRIARAIPRNLLAHGSRTRSSRPDRSTLSTPMAHQAITTAVDTNSTSYVTRELAWHVSAVRRLPDIARAGSHAKSSSAPGVSDTISVAGRRLRSMIRYRSRWKVPWASSRNPGGREADAETCVVGRGAKGNRWIVPKRRREVRPHRVSRWQDRCRIVAWTSQWPNRFCRCSRSVEVLSLMATIEETADSRRRQDRATG